MPAGQNVKPAVGCIAFSIALLFLLLTTSQRGPSDAYGSDDDGDSGAAPSRYVDVERHGGAAADDAAVTAKINAVQAPGRTPRPTEPPLTDDPRQDAVRFADGTHHLRWRGGGCFRGATVANTARLWRNCDGAGGPTAPPATKAPAPAATNSSGGGVDDDDEGEDESAKLSRPGRVHCAFGVAASNANVGPLGFNANSPYATLNTSHRCLVWRHGSWCAASSAASSERCETPALLTGKELQRVAGRVLATRKQCAFDFLRRPQDDESDGAFALNRETGRVFVRLPKPCADGGVDGAAVESFTAVELLALLHRAAANGTRPIVLSGDSMLRQLLFRLVFELRGKQPAVEYNGWFDVTYIVRGRGDELQYRISSKTVAKQILRNLDDDDVAEVLNPPRLPCHVGPSVPEADRCLLQVQFLWEPYEDTYSRALFLRNRPPADPRADAALMRAAKGVEEADAPASPQAAAGAESADDRDDDKGDHDTVTIARARSSAKGRGGVNRTKCRPHVVFDREGYHVAVPAPFVPALHLHAAMYWFPIGRSTKKQRAMRKASAGDDGVSVGPEGVHRSGSPPGMFGGYANPETADDAPEDDLLDIETAEAQERRSFGAQGTPAHRVRTGQRRRSSKPIKQLRRIMKFFEHVAAGSQHLSWLPAPGSTEKDCPVPSQRTRVGYHFFAIGTPLLRGASVNTTAAASEELRNRNQMVVRRNHAAGTAINRAANHTGSLCEASDRGSIADGVTPNPKDRPSLLDAGASLHFVDFQGLLRQMSPRELRERSKDPKHFLCSLHPPFPRPVYGSADDHKGCVDDINKAMWTWLTRAVVELARMPADGPEGAVADTWLP